MALTHLYLLGTLDPVPRNVTAGYILLSEDSFFA